MDYDRKSIEFVDAPPPLQSAIASGSAAYCASAVLAHPIVLLMSHEAVRGLSDIANRETSHANPSEWLFLIHCVEQCAEAERRVAG